MAWLGMTIPMNDCLLLWAYMTGWREGIRRAERLIAGDSETPLTGVGLEDGESEAKQRRQFAPHPRRNCAASHRVVDRA